MRGTTGWGMALVAAFALSAAPACESKSKRAERKKENAKVPEKERGKPHQVARNSEPHPPDAKVKFDVAFVIDSTGSMGKLIGVAKNRIRDIAKYVESGKPKPSVRFAVVAYRDKGDAYITRTYGLTPHIAKTEKALSEITAGGGGDRPEHVVAGLRKAVIDLAWDQDAKLKFVFLIGDAEAQVKYPDSNVDDVIQSAKKNNIKVGAISLAAMPPVGVKFWAKVANETGGPSEGIAAEAAVESVINSAIATEAAKSAGVTY